MSKSVMCAKCEGKIFTCDIGKCGTCGGHTSSGMFERCAECARKEGVCMACLANNASEEEHPNIIKGID